MLSPHAGLFWVSLLTYSFVIGDTIVFYGDKCEKDFLISGLRFNLSKSYIFSIGEMLPRGGRLALINNVLSGMPTCFLLPFPILVLLIVGRDLTELF